MEPEKERNIRLSFILHPCSFSFCAQLRWNLTDYNQGKAIAQLPQVRHQVRQNQKLKEQQQETQSRLVLASKSSASSLEEVGCQKVSNS